ncbi:Cytochrome P450 [Niveomyces insectorum RCEF 264]|uniref:Cytochrome P450 n=1 Tax=Niveomyces insectorum RCEF 264 TaxID=1081102 RepID=A0A167SKT7_9HYPO|nr:Cytochrome P450 [Niveomyces insectorum RCEF 264]
MTVVAMRTLEAWASRVVPLVAAVFSALLAAWLLPKCFNYIRLAAIPIVGKDLGSKEQRRQTYLTNARELYIDGYKRFKDAVFRITTSRDATVIVLTPKFLRELNKLPDTVLSFSKASNDTDVPIVPHTIAAKLTPALPRLSVQMAEEAGLALAREIPPTDGWNEVAVYQKLVRIVAMISGHVFVGPELSRTETYLDAAINYTLEISAAQRAVQEMRPWLRPFLARRLPAVQTLYRRAREADDFLRPVINRRKQPDALKDSTTPDDLLQWLIDALPQHPDEHSQDLAQVQLSLIFAAVHTTTIVTTNAFYNLAAMQEYIPILRQEVVQVLSDNDGAFTWRALQSMKKMDSFIKETLRLHPVTMVSFQRKVLKPITLSNGQHLPAGVTIEVPAVAVSSDPTIYPDPLTFDGLRYCGPRKADGNPAAAAHNQFVSVGPTDLVFGFGRHACPGRFFAANQIKMILAHALLRYDVQLEDGCTERYPNMEFANMVR